MSSPLTGGCACGAVRYECLNPPMFTWVCHCRECQRSTGGGGAVNVVLTKPDVEWTRGAPKYHESIGTSGAKTRRGFCRECGSPLAAQADVFPQIQGISAASFDDPGQLELVAHIWTDSVQPWDTLTLGLPAIAQTPTEQELQKLLGH